MMAAICFEKTLGRQRSRETEAKRRWEEGRQTTGRQRKGQSDLILRVLDGDPGAQVFLSPQNVCLCLQSAEVHIHFNTVTAEPRRGIKGNLLGLERVNAAALLAVGGRKEQKEREKKKPRSAGVIECWCAKGHLPAETRCN